MPECPLQTSEGVKAIDVVWVSRERRKSKPNDPVFLVAPEICIEVASPSNRHEEFMERKRLYFEPGAVGFWVCDLLGKMTFYDRSGAITPSTLYPAFPRQIELD